MMETTKPFDSNLAQTPFIPAHRIAILRALQLGDLLCAVPAFRALRAAYPQAKISLIGLPWAKSFVERFDAYFDAFIEFPGYPGLPEREPELQRIPLWLREMQAEQFDLALQMQGSGSIVNELLVLMGARVNAGFYTPDGYPAPQHFLLYPENEPEVWRHLRLMERLGIPLQGDALEFPLLPQDYAELAAVPEAQELLPQTYACVHPGARYLTRRWLPESFAQLGDALAAQGLTVVLTGTAEEIGLTATIARAMRAPALDVCGKTSLGALGVLLKNARLLVCNDTGVSHMAAALRVPSVVIGLSSDIPRWAPLDRTRHRVIYHPIECSPCGFPICPIGHVCVTSVGAPEVIETAREMLGREMFVMPRAAAEEIAYA